MLATLLDALFPLGHAVRVDRDVVTGEANTAAGTVTVIGTCDHAEIGVEHAMQLAAAVLDSTREHPARPIVMLVDTAGQRLSRRDELLGINGYLAHVAQCLEIARRRGARLVSIVYCEAVSGGFLSFGLMADEIVALPDAQVRVMNLQAMARVTRQPVERLEALSRTSPVFAPGVENYVAMGAVSAVWQGDLAKRLEEALRRRTDEARPRLTRGHAGRELADEVVRRVVDGCS